MDFNEGDTVAAWGDLAVVLAPTDADDIYVTVRFENADAWAFVAIEDVRLVRRLGDA